MDDRKEIFSHDSGKQTQKLARGAIEEARMVLPGIQALFGFQLIAVFNNRFLAGLLRRSTCRFDVLFR
ncbi:hypothetical protein [Methylocystis sp. B8]|uniref:hypothetical protein n=1 Tax=Methylocystis sp. B8 TaxID=544938 RepID=UPI0010FE6F53|nr:hypothetical protein [Methylocystis sp. B8]TLG71825.1 hypothetical protein FEV16_15110 [Methylocystis sp. B8]